MLDIVVLISGNGSNLQAIIDNVHADDNVDARIVAVISNQAQAYGLQRAQQAGIETHVIENSRYTTRNDYDNALQDVILSLNPQLLVLAGFMRILSDDFVNHFSGRLINIHPSLLPKYTGLNTHQRVIDAGETHHGASVHFVIPELDAGPLILQAEIPIHDYDTAAELAQRVHTQEHIIYPLAIQWFAEGRIKMHQGKTFKDNKELKPEAAMLHSL